MNHQKQPRYWAAPRAKGKVAHYLVLGKINGRLKKILYKTKQEALDNIPIIAEQRREKGNLSFVSDNPVLRAEVAKCLEILKPYGASLTEAAQFYIKHSGLNPQDAFFISEAIDFWKAAKDKKLLRSHATKKTVDSYYKPFAKFFGEETLINFITTSQIEEYLDSHADTWSALTYNNHLGNLRGLYRFLIKTKHATLNPLDGLEKKTVVTQDVKLLTADQVKRAFDYCLTKEKYNCMGYMALVTFCGVRPDEARRLTWDDINFETNRVTIHHGKTKKGRKRINDIPPNAIQWLEKVKESFTQTEGVNIVNTIGQAAAMKYMWKKLGIKYPQNALRHSFATYHWLKHESQDKTMRAMGHHDGELLHFRYNEMSTKEEAKKFFKISITPVLDPEEEAEILKMRLALMQGSLHPIKYDFGS